jgi:hypothetical protein
MNGTNEFDHWLERPGVRQKTFTVDAGIEARDTLQGCWLMAKSVFGDQARPEHAITLLPLLLDRADARRQSAQAAAAARTPDAT